MKKFLYFGYAFILLLAIYGCGSEATDKASGPKESQFTSQNIPPEVGIVLKLFAGQPVQSDENNEKKGILLKTIEDQTGGPSILWKFGTGVSKDGICQYEGWEKYTPENLNANTIRETFIYDKCKKDHPIALDRISWLDGFQVIDSRDPDYKGSNPLGYPYLAVREVSKYYENFTEKEFYKNGMLLHSSYAPKLTSGSYVEFDTSYLLPNISRHFDWMDGTVSTYHTRGTSDLSDDYTVEAIYKNYLSDAFMSDFDGNGKPMTLRSITNGYIKQTWLETYGTFYEDFNVLITNTKDGASYRTIDGALTPDSCSGEKIEIKTLLSIYKPTMFSCPIEGELLVTRGNRKVTLRFLENQTVEVDIDGDGVADDTVNCQAVMDSDFCM